jgi:hypothetical protein
MTYRSITNRRTEVLPSDGVFVNYTGQIHEACLAYNISQLLNRQFQGYV